MKDEIKEILEQHLEMLSEISSGAKIEDAIELYAITEAIKQTVLTLMIIDKL